MSEPVSALHGISDDHGLVRITELGPRGMITLRGDLASSAIKKAATKGTDLSLPGPGQAVLSGDDGVAWMSPDELLVMCAYDDVQARLARMTKATQGKHALAVNVSDARAVIEVSGTRAREVVAKLAPVDLSPDAFTPGMFRRTRMAQVAAAFWMHDDTTFRIICFRSQARYVFDLLKVAAQPGSEVDYF
ncbi:sarcosine oxidase subunit gamma [Sulfitobacter sabulilitoris]|uniref:Sarcosine oxidase subunit gamma n=1 Tax=Sulfitobacter sabulilitoris TaxID=2562655 RepID=A0A5S3PIN9_9RHOB|nr:sarcosine oxidase subunit gamma family protein [Sulfitobacter sabulilitoris]TMM54243.1 sarcosine oxidase subunit gamma [Sulfitobacter sabulilitoris]